jgi:hypothetical protein
VFSQRYKDLEHRAETWIKFRNSKVRTVIGLDLNDAYKSSQNQSATLYVWKSRYGKPELVVKSKVCFFSVTPSMIEIPDQNYEAVSRRERQGYPRRQSMPFIEFLQDNDVQENSRVSDPNLLISSGMIVKALEDEVEERETEKTSREEVKNRIKARKSNKRFSPLRIVSRWSGTLRKQKMVNYKPMMKR